MWLLFVVLQQTKVKRDCCTCIAIRFPCLSNHIIYLWLYSSQLPFFSLQKLPDCTSTLNKRPRLQNARVRGAISLSLIFFLDALLN